MDLSMFDIATVGLPPDSADFGGRAAWESPQPCRKSIFYTWSVRVFSEQVHTLQDSSTTAARIIGFSNMISMSHTQVVQLGRNLYKLHNF
jgi:hypothetical protein